MTQVRLGKHGYSRLNSTQFGTGLSAPLALSRIVFSWKHAAYVPALLVLSPRLNFRDRPLTTKALSIRHIHPDFVAEEHFDAARKRKIKERFLHLNLLW